MKVTSKVNTKNLKMIKKDMISTLVQTADAVKSDLVQSQTMPFDIGTLQKESTFIDDKNKNKGVVSIVSDTPYARYLYFGKNHFKEYKTDLNFNKDKNSKAGPFWFDPYINGKKKNFAKSAFKILSGGKYK